MNTLHRNISILLFLLIVPFTGLAQSFKYSYDKSGNCVSRIIEIAKVTLQPEENQNTLQKSINSSKLNYDSFHVFPNPTSDYIKIQIANYYPHIDGFINFVITDISGHSMMKGKLTSSQTEIDLTKQNSGIYMLILNTTHSQFTWKIIKK